MSIFRTLAVLAPALHAPASSRCVAGLNIAGVAVLTADVKIAQCRVTVDVMSPLHASKCTAELCCNVQIA